MTHELFAIGPLDGTTEQQGRIAYFLYPGIADMPVVFGNHLADVAPQFTQTIPADQITAEPALEAEATALGLAVRPLSDAAREVLGATAFDLATPEAFAGCEDTTLIGDFATAAQQFQAATPVEWSPSYRSLGITFEDETDSYGVVIIPGPGLCVLSDLAPGSQADADSITSYDGMAAVFAPTSRSIADAFHRAYGLDGCPQPFALHRGQKLALPAPGLARLTATLCACTALQAQQATSTTTTNMPRSAPVRAKVWVAS